jgi:ribosomal protein S18 acetylase RimI-like enzyme
VTQLEIRPATLADVETVVRIMSEASEWIVERGDPPWNRRPWRAADVQDKIARAETYLALEGGQAVATVTVQPSDEWLWPGRPPDALYVHRLAVARAAHGRKVGAGLLDFAERLATDEGRQYVRLDCHCDNPKLRAYYVARGFAWLGDRVTGIPPDDYCASLLEKAL